MLIERGVNCLVDEPNLYNLYKIENIIILFIALVLYHWLHIIRFRNF